MTTAVAPPSSVSSLERGVEALFAYANTDVPAVLSDTRRAALSRFYELGLPRRHQEEWRFVDLAPVSSQSWQRFEPVERVFYPELITKLSLPNEEVAARFVFINGHFSAADSYLEILPAGITVSTLKQSYTDNAHQLLSVWQEALTGFEVDDAFQQLNAAIAEDGVLVVVPDNTVLEKPVQIVFITEGNPKISGIISPRILIQVGENSKLVMSTSYKGASQLPGTYLTNSWVGIQAKAGADIEYSSIQTESQSASHFNAIKISAQTKSHVRVNAIALGARLARTQIEARHDGENASICLNGLSVLSGNTQIFDSTVVDHAVPHCETTQLYKGILDGSSRSEFDGTIVIRKDAQKTEASQMNRNLLLSENARVMTRPQLRIDADDVKCAHGATVGQLRQEELFYLTSRGISQAMAKTILTYGFAEDILHKISIPTLKSRLIDRVHELLQDASPEVSV